MLIRHLSKVGVTKQERTADDLVEAGRKRGQAGPRAVAFLREQLAQGEYRPKGEA